MRSVLGHFGVALIVIVATNIAFWTTCFGVGVLTFPNEHSPTPIAPFIAGGLSGAIVASWLIYRFWLKKR
jgi:hypothetical protein